MSLTNTLITLAIVAWILHIALGWWQITRFNRAFMALSATGQIGIGRSNGKRFQPRVILALVFDEDGKVSNSLIMKGYTVFTQPKPLPVLHGLTLQELKSQSLFPHNKAIQSALNSAISPKAA